MISQEYKILAKEIMQFALANGANDARISIASGSSSTFEYRDKQLDKLQQASENRMEIELFVDGRYGSYSTNRIDVEGLKKFTLSAIASTKYLDKDPYRKLPDPARYYNGNKDLKTYDSEFENISVDTKLQLAQDAINEIYGTDPGIISVTGEYSDGDSFLYIIASNGFEGETAHTSYSVFANVAIKGKDDARPSDYWFESSLHFNNLVKTGIGKKAYERVIQKLGQTKIESGKYAMLIDNTQSVRLLAPILSALNGHALHQKNSFLLDKLNEQIVSDKVTITDDPHIESAFGARMFDGEGVATVKRNIIEKGILKTYFIDTYSAAKLETEPTIASPSIVTFELGEKNHEQMLASLSKGIWVTGFNGGNSNSSTGDFSFGIEGFLIENGKITKPISEMNITGNLLTLWNNLLEIGNDPKLNTSRRVPSLLFGNVDFSGS